jgi:cytoskeletal protein CcmA (bactofilin family)
MKLLRLWPFRGGAVPKYAADTVTAPGTSIQGDLRGPGGFRIEGAVQGTIEADGPVVIGREGSVDGAVRGHDVVVLGRVRGDIRASGHLEIGPDGCVIGDVTVTSVRVHAGGALHGTSRIGDPGLAVAELEHMSPTLRTLPPPIGAVPPPPVNPITVSGLGPIRAEDRPAPRASGQERIEPVKTAAND